MKLHFFFLVIISSLLSCNALNNRSDFNRVDCGEAVSDDYIYVLDSKKNRLSAADIQILMRGGASQLVRNVAPTSKGCFSKDLLQSGDTLLIKAAAQKEMQIVNHGLIDGRTSIVLQPLPDKRPSIVCNYNLVDTTLFLNQFITFNDASFLEFYNVSASISSGQQLVARADQRPLLNAGTYDLRTLIRGQIYNMDLQIHDFVFSDGSPTSTTCELDLDIPNLSARLGDAIKEYRNYFGESYGVVDQGYELNFYIEGGLKTVNIDYCVVSLDPEKTSTLPADANCADLNLPIKSYTSDEKGERFDSGFWLVLYRYKKGLLTKPWVAQKLMVRKVCETARYKVEEFDQNFCTDIMGNINLAGTEFKGKLEIKYASLLLGQLYLYNTGYQEVSLPNLEFASQIDFDQNYVLERIGFPSLSQVSLNMNFVGNSVLRDIQSWVKLERIGSFFNLDGSDLQSLAGLENLKTVGSSFTIHNNKALQDIVQLQSLELIGGAFTIQANPALKKIEGLHKLAFIGLDLILTDNKNLESFDLKSKPSFSWGIGVADNPNLRFLSGFENIRSTGALAVLRNAKLVSMDTFKNIEGLDSLRIYGSPTLMNFKDFKSLRAIRQTLEIEDLVGLQSFDGLQAIEQLGKLLVKNTGVSNFSGLENLKTVSNLQLISNANLQSLQGLASLSRIDQALGVVNNQSLLTLAGTSLYRQSIQDVNIDFNSKLKDLAILNSLESSGFMIIRYNNALPSLGDLRNLKKIVYDFSLINNMDLQNLEGLNHLETIGGDFKLDTNGELTSLSGLSRLTRVGGSLSIIGATRLRNLEGLESLKQVGDRIIISNNYYLQTLKGLDSLESVGFFGFTFQYNNSLVNPCAFFLDPVKVSCRT